MLSPPHILDSVQIVILSKVPKCSMTPACVLSIPCWTCTKHISRSPQFTIYILNRIHMYTEISLHISVFNIICSAILTCAPYFEISGETVPLVIEISVKSTYILYSYMHADHASLCVELFHLFSHKPTKSERMRKDEYINPKSNEPDSLISTE